MSNDLATENLLTAEQYLVLPDNGQPSELVRGRIVMMNIPGARHGWICTQLICLLGEWVHQRDLGYVLSISGILTQRSPETVRGADVSFYSYNRLPKGRLPEGYSHNSPELVFEVLSPGNKWKDLLAKVAEYLNAGVLTVCVVDSVRRNITVYTADKPAETLTVDQRLVLPEILPGFSLPLHQLFPDESRT